MDCRRLPRTLPLLMVAAALAVGVPRFLASAPREAPSAPGRPAAPSDLGDGLERFVIVPSESRALYRARETFLRFNRPNAAVGVTQAISGEILVDRANPASVRLSPVRVDISQLASDQARRDEAIRGGWLESARYPIAEFVPVAVEGMPKALAEGQEIAITLQGHLTIRDVTRPAAFATTFTLDGDTIRGSARTTLRMTDFGFEPPSILGVLRSEDEVEIEVQVVARRVG